MLEIPLRLTRKLSVAIAALVLASIASSATAQGIPCVAGFAGPYPCNNVDLLAVVPSGALVAAGGDPSSGSDMWGWTDPETGREYAIQTLSDAVAFVDVTVPTDPVFVGYLPAPVLNVLWRDVKVYANHAYIVGDFSPLSTDDSNPGADHGLQIFDLTRLRGAAPMTVFTETSRYLGFDEAHNFVVNEESGFGYAVASDTCGGGMHMLDLEPDPANPVFVGCWDDGGINVHDAQCVIYRGPDVEHQGREICMNANEDALDIVDVTDKSAPVRLSRSFYAGQSYVHQGWLTEDHVFFVSNDESDELDALTAGNPHNTHTYLWDVSDLDNPVQTSTYVGPTAAIDHNLYIRGRFVHQANYTAGYRVLDAADIANGKLTEIGYFDTHFEDGGIDQTVFAGTWSNYPFFESGIVVASQIEDGFLFVLQPHLPADPDGGEAGDKATGGGWLAAAGGGKIHFGFNVRSTGSGPAGELQLNDKGAGVKIHLKDVVLAGAVQGQCGGIVAADNALEFRGTGSFNKDTAASFRVCVEDNGEPGSGSSADPDRFHLECVAGCGYSTADSAAGAELAGGNIQVRRAAGATGGGGAAPATLVLDPLLLDSGAAGAIQVFQIRAWDGDQEPASGAGVTLVRETSSGSPEHFSAVTDLAGLAVVTVTHAGTTADYRAVSGAAVSNHVEVEPLLP